MPQPYAMPLKDNHLKYRVMQAADLDRVYDNERRSYAFPWSRGVLEDCLQGSYECWVVEVAGELVGHGIISHVLDETHLLNLCVSPAFQRQGLGRAFLKFLIDRAIRHQASVFYLEVRVSNREAINLYFSEGFNEVGVRPAYYPSCKGREDGLLMTLQLSIDAFQ